MTDQTDTPMAPPEVEHHPAVFLRRNMATAERCQEILRLPDDSWTEVQIHFGTDGLAIATVGFVITGDQLLALAELAAHPPKPPPEFPAFMEGRLDGPPPPVLPS